MGALHEIPLLAWTFLVGLPLLGFVLRRRRHIPSALGIKMNVREVNDSLHKLDQPMGNPQMQVLFFHGFPFGDFSNTHLSTWESGDGSCIWPLTWLVEEFPGAHPYFVSYSEGLKKGSVDRFDMNIIAENLISDLIQADIGQLPRCPVVLVGHCIGGLVIKQLCLKAHEKLRLSSASVSERTKLETFLDSVKGIFYYSTPHHGTPHIAKAARIVYGPLFKYFETLSTDAERLNSHFNDLCHLYSKWQIKGIGESLPVNSGVFRGEVVVPEASAREGDFNMVIADHFTICKPEKKTSSSFYSLTCLLHTVANSLKEETKLQEESHAANFQYLPHQPIGLEIPLQGVKAMLQSVTRLGLRGMGGLGKTTLAKVVFNSLACTFEYTCFVSEVKFIMGNVQTLKLEVWKQMHRNGKKVGADADWSQLCGKRLLLVLDDISGERDVTVLSEMASGCSLESRFITTSREAGLLDDEYLVPQLDGDIGQQLFKSYAFPNQSTPPDYLVTLMGEIIEKCEGLPLTLEVVGQWLRRTKSKDDWEQALHALGKAEAFTHFNERLWAKLKLSYDGLEENEKQMFLDATTFFQGQAESLALTLCEAKAAWREAYGVSENLLWQTLMDRSLVYNVKEDESIKVHEQLQSLGQKIASESTDKCRVWEKPEALKLLQMTNESNNKDIHALRLVGDRWTLGDEGCSTDQIHIASPTLQQLKNLRYLEIDGPVVDGALQDKWLPRNLVLLRWVNVQFFDPSHLTGLAVLILDRFHGKDLPECIGQLLALRIFRLRRAGNLRRIPDEIRHLSRLERLDLFSCNCLQTLPETFGQLSRLKYVRLEDCSSLYTLPESFGNLSALEHLELLYCKEFQRLPETFWSLPALVGLKFRGCHNLLALPDSFGHLPALSHLEFDKCGLQSLPESFGNLLTLSHLRFSWCDDIHSLPESFGHLPALSRLVFDMCGLHSLPESFGNLLMLSHLEFHGCGWLQSLPESFGNLLTLSHLVVDMCGFKRLRESFGNVFTLPESFGNLLTLCHLVVQMCWLQSLPESFRNLLTLSHLELDLCGDIDSLPFGHLPNLQYLTISGQIADGNWTLDGLRDCLAGLKGLRYLSIDHLPIASIPDCIKNLPSLRTLVLCTLPYVNEFPPWLGETGEHPIARSRKEFQIQDQSFSLTTDEIVQDPLYMVTAAHNRAMSKVGTSNYGGALAALLVSDCGVLYLQGFLLQEKGIIKRMMGELQGAWDDLTAALEVFSKADDGHHYIYDCWKHRGYVNFLMGNLEGAEADGAMALKLQLEYCGDKISGTLGEQLVSYMHFRLEGKAEMDEHKGLWKSLHSQAMEDVRASDFQGALASFDLIDSRLLTYDERAFFLLERGILKELVGDLAGALEDLTAAFETDEGNYQVLKHRAYVKYLLDDLEGARTDAERCLKVRDGGGDRWWIQGLGLRPVEFLNFKLE